jgi:hypothetical protein
MNFSCHWSLSIHFNIHFILSWNSFLHTLTLQFIFLGWICAPLFQAPSLKVFQALNINFEGRCPYQHLVKLGTSNRLCLLCVFFYPSSCPFLIQTFPPFLANGLGVRVSSMLLLLGGIHSTSPNIVCP